MKPLPPSAFRPQPSATDPEVAMQELDDWSTIVMIRSFLVIFWIQDRWAGLRRGVRSAGALALAVLCAMAALVMGVALIVGYLVRRLAGGLRSFFIPQPKPQTKAN